MSIANSVPRATSANKSLSWVDFLAILNLIQLRKLHSENLLVRTLPVDIFLHSWRA